MFVPAQSMGVECWTESNKIIIIDQTDKMEEYREATPTEDTWHMKERNSLPTSALIQNTAL